MKRFSVIGVGGAGSQFIYYLTDKNIPNLNLYLINTEKSSLFEKLDNVYLLGNPENKKHNDPIFAETLARNSKEDFSNFIINNDFIFLFAGLGGGTGTGISPVIAEIAKENNKKIIAFVTLPLPFEGEQRKMNARLALEKLHNLCDKVFELEFNISKEITLYQFFSDIHDRAKDKIIEYINSYD